ncbi:hypothetical protein [uncultured Rothia sp.]|uniref:hypothetical protein n=1 Tax=uncultured Rothia sp. TaxID=316088 RepID=UPI0025E2A9A3|nr:hypothetical protein [uncultured Rothia sp.]
MADRPTAKREGTHHENMKHEEAYQPLWDTDQSIPEYMTLLMVEQPSTTEDAEPNEDSEEYEYEELEHPDPDYEYVYPGAPKRYDSARKDSEDEELEYEDVEYEDDEYEDVEHEDAEYEDDEYESEPSDDADDNENDTENSQDNQFVALTSTQPAQPTEPTQPALSACEGATENTGNIMIDRAQAQSPQEPTKPSTVDTSLSVATEPVYGIPDPNLQPMQLLGALSSDAGPTQLASVRWWNKSGAAVAPWDAPGEETETARIIGYIPASTPEATVDWAKARRGYMPWVIFMVAMQVINPFLLLPLVNIVSMDAALQLLVLYLALAMQTTLLAPLIWLILMVYSLVKFLQKRQDAVARATTYGAFWYHPVYDRPLQEGAHPDEAVKPEGLPASAE